MAVKNEAVVLRERRRCLLCWEGAQLHPVGSCVAFGPAMLPKYFFSRLFWRWSHRAFCCRAVWFFALAVSFYHCSSRRDISVQNRGKGCTFWTEKYILFYSHMHPLVILAELVLISYYWSPIGSFCAFFSSICCKHWPQIPPSSCLCVAFPVHQRLKVFFGLVGPVSGVSGFICCFAFLQATTPFISVCTCPKATGVGDAIVEDPATRTKRRSWQKTPLTNQTRKTTTTRATAFWSPSVSSDGLPVLDG